MKSKCNKAFSLFKLTGNGPVGPVGRSVQSRVHWVN